MSLLLLGFILLRWLLWSEPTSEYMSTKCLWGNHGLTKKSSSCWIKLVPILFALWLLGNHSYHRISLAGPCCGCRAYTKCHCQVYCSIHVASQSWQGHHVTTVHRGTLGKTSDLHQAIHALELFVQSFYILMIVMLLALGWKYWLNCYHTAIISFISVNVAVEDRKSVV